MWGNKSYRFMQGADIANRLWWSYILYNIHIIRYTYTIVCNDVGILTALWMRSDLQNRIVLSRFARRFWIISTHTFCTDKFQWVLCLKRLWSQRLAWTKEKMLVSTSSVFCISSSKCYWTDTHSLNLKNNDYWQCLIKMVWLNI